MVMDSAGRALGLANTSTPSSMDTREIGQSLHSCRVSEAGDAKADRSPAAFSPWKNL
jgi:hypothetical protein